MERRLRPPGDARKIAHRVGGGQRPAARPVLGIPGKPPFFAAVSFPAVTAAFAVWQPQAAKTKRGQKGWDALDLKEESILGPSIRDHWYYVAKGRALRKIIGEARVPEVLDVGAGSGCSPAS